MSKTRDAPQEQRGPTVTYVIPDTSVYLHCQFFKDVDWPSLVNRPKVTLLLPMPVMRELDKHKDSHSQRRRRERARRVIAEFKHAQANPEAELRRGVAFESYRCALTPKDLDPYSLDRDIPDDRIVATILRFQRHHPQAEIVLVARDGTMSFTARDLGLTVVDPTSIEEPDEPDEIERELQASKKRNAELESRIPRLKLTFEDGKEHMKMRAPAFEPGGEEALAALRREKLLVHSPPASFYSRADRGELLRYTEEHRDYMADVALYFDDAEAWRAREARTVVLSPRLENVGRVPAESSSVEMLFPEGIEVETEESRPRRPLEPRAPELPVDYGGLIIISPSRFRPKYERGFRPSKAETASDHLGGGLTGLWLPKIKRLPDGRTFFGENFQKVQQATSEVVGPLYLVMPERIESFNIEFLLKADHMEQVRGQLHVVVERDE